MDYKGLRDAAPAVLAGAAAAQVVSAFQSHGVRALALFALGGLTGALAILAGWPR